MNANRKQTAVNKLTASKHCSEYSLQIIYGK